ncbi:MAG: thioesterase family protein [Kofleriaceae bacterium]
MRTFDSEPIAQILAASKSETSLELGSTLWGFGGVQGGLALGLLAVALQHRADGRVLQRISGQFRRPLRGAFSVGGIEEGAGKTVSWLSARATMKDTIAVTADAVFAAPGKALVSPVSAPMPPAPPPLECETFTVPPEFVPFASRTEIRPVGGLPFRGAKEPELTAWLRLVDDDLPPDEARLITLMDSLAPSLGAVLTRPTVIPTVTFTLTPGSGLRRATSPWLLLRARTAVAQADGWHVERLDAWSPDGAHLGVGEQLRFIMDQK